jgi:hypothetical protein
MVAARRKKVVNIRSVLTAEIAEDLRIDLEQVKSVLGDLQQRSAAVGRP